MAVDPLKNLPINRGEQLKIEAPSQERGKGVRLYDVDLAIAEHMIDTVVPSIEVFREKVKVPVLGVIENMSYHICDNCGHHSHLFGQQGGQDIADINEVDLLGQLPLNILIREHADLGRSLFVSEQANKLESESTSDISEQYRTIARKTASKVFYELDMRSPQTPDVNFIEPSL